MSSKAFTLIEFMIASAIMVIMLTCASFYFSSQQQTAKADAVINHLQQLLLTAKLQSIKSNMPVTVCELTSSGGCSGDWQGVISVFSDNQTIQKVRLVTDKKASLSFSGFPTSKYIKMTALGLSGQQNGTFVYCASFGAELILRGLTISRTGRIRLLTQNDPYFKDTHTC